MTVRQRAIVLMISAAILWSIGGLLIKLVDAHPLAIAGTRSLIAACTLLAYVRKPKITWSSAQVGGALSYAGMVILFVAANKTTKAANAIMLQFTAPIYVAILGAWILKEKTKPVDWLMVFLVMGGMALFFVGNLSASGVLGNIIALGSGVSFALFTIFMRLQKDGSPVESVLLGNFITALIGLPFLSLGIPDLNGWLCLIILGVFQLGISYIMYSTAIKSASALEAVLIPVVEPLLNPVWVFLRFGEIPGPWAFVGAVIIIVVITVRCALASIPAKDNGIAAGGKI